MAYQTTYTMNQPIGIPGFQADMSEWDASTKTATATIAFGAPVQRSGDKSAAPFANGGEYVGIAKGCHKVSGSIADSYDQGDNMAVVNEGVWFGTAGAAIAAGAALNFDTVAGRWTTAATSATVLAVPGSEADTSASGNGVVFTIRLRRVPA